MRESLLTLRLGPDFTPLLRTTDPSPALYVSFLRGQLLIEDGLILPRVRYQEDAMPPGRLAADCGELKVENEAQPGSFFDILFFLMRTVQSRRDLFCAWPEFPAAHSLAALAEAGPPLEIVLRVARQGLLYRCPPELFLELLRPHLAHRGAAGLAARLLDNGAVSSQSVSRRYLEQAASLYRRSGAADAQRRRDVLLKLGVLALDRGRLGLAERHFRQVTRSPRPEFASEGWTQLGLVHVCAGRLEQGLEAWDRSLELHPKGAVRFQRNQLAELLGAPATGPPPPRLPRRVRRLVGQGRAREALELLQQRPETEFVRREKVLVLGELGERAQALDLARGLQDGRLAEVLGDPPSPRPESRSLLWYGGPHQVHSIRVRPLIWREPGQEIGYWSARAAACVAALADFHQRHFPGHPLLVEEPVDLGEGPAEHTFWQSWHLRSPTPFASLLPRSVTVGEVSLLFCAVAGDPSWGRGFRGLSILLLGAETGWPEYLVGHEFYHSALELRHTDGFQDDHDPNSLMDVGAWSAPLWAMWLSPFQVEACLCPPELESQLRACWKEPPAIRLKRYLELLEEAPLHPWLNRVATELLLEGRRFREAEGVLRRRLQAGTSFWAARQLALLYDRMGKGREARRVIESHPGPRTQSNLIDMSHALIWANQPDSARRCLLEALKDDVTPRLLADLGVVWLNLWQGEPGAALLRAALRYHPEEPDYMVRLAAALIMTGELKEARSWLRRTRRAAPRAREPRFLEAYLDCVEGRWERALRRARRLHPSEGWNFAIGEVIGYCCWQLGDLDGAREGFESVRRESKVARAWLRWLDGRKPPERWLRPARTLFQKDLLARIGEKK